MAITAPRIFVYGAGRCGLFMQGFAMRLAQFGVAARVVGSPTTTAAEPGDTLLIGSGSGSTGSTLAIARAGKAVPVRLTALTAAAGSPLTEIADETILLPGTAKNDAGRPSRQPPGSLFEQILFVVLEEATLIVARRCDTDFTRYRSRHANLE